MFKKSLLLLTALAIATPVMAAPAKKSAAAPAPAAGTEVTNPFFGPSAGKFSSTTSLETTSVRYSDNFGVERTSNTFLDEAVSYGILDTLSIDGAISNDWMRWKQDGEVTLDENKNIDWYAGMTYAPSFGAFKTQFKAIYGQKNSQSYGNDGMYRYGKLKAKVGYDIKDIFLPYASVSWELPIAAGHGADGAQFKSTYEARVGAYKLWCPSIATDIGVSYNNLRDYKINAWNLDAEVSYLFTDNVSLGVYGSYILDGHYADQGDVSSGGQAGVRFRAQF